MAILICEGGCNPTLPDLDAAVRRTTAFESSSQADNGTTTERQIHVPAAPDLVRRLRALKHTTHVYVERRPNHATTSSTGTTYRVYHDYWVCAECGIERVWG